MLSYQNCKLFLIVRFFVIPVRGLLRGLQLAIAMSLAQDGQQCAMTVWAGSVAISVGAIWAVHLIACDTGMPTHVALLAISMGCVCQGALASASGRFSGLKLIRVTMFMGLGMAGVCHLSVLAIQMNANIGYNMDIVIVSLLIAVVAAPMVRVWLTLLARHVANVWMRAIYGGVRSAFLWHLYGNARRDESLDLGDRCRLSTRQPSEHGHFATASSTFIVALLI